jgi:hypothetical protein
MAEGVVLRRPRVSAFAQAVDLDRRAAATLSKMRDRSGTATRRHDRDHQRMAASGSPPAHGSRCVQPWHLDKRLTAGLEDLPFPVRRNVTVTLRINPPEGGTRLRKW